MTRTILSLAAAVVLSISFGADSAAALPKLNQPPVSQYTPRNKLEHQPNSCAKILTLAKFHADRGDDRRSRSVMQRFRAACR